MLAENQKEKIIRRNQIKIWVFGVLTLILVIMAISLSMTGQKEMVTPVDADGSTVYIPNENAVNFFVGETISAIVIIPLAVVSLAITIICFIKNIRLRKR